MGVHKGVVVPLLLADADAQAHTLAIGDDRTDEDLFAALPPDAICLRVGDGPSIAPYRLADPEAVRVFLRKLLLAREEEAAPRHPETEVALTG
jgi:trehalose 6-phosphate synthase/phosphatase